MNILNRRFGGRRSRQSGEVSSSAVADAAAEGDAAEGDAEEGDVAGGVTDAAASADADVGEESRDATSSSFEGVVDRALTRYCASEEAHSALVEILERRLNNRLSDRRNSIASSDAAADAVEAVEVAGRRPETLEGSDRASELWRRMEDLDDCGNDQNDEYRFGNFPLRNESLQASNGFVDSFL